MSWGSTRRWGSSIQEVVDAFYAGKSRKRNNAHTDGTTYWLFGNAIARRNSAYNAPDAVEAKLLGRDYMKRIEFTWAGWTRPTTERHLRALGLDCYCGRKDVPAQFEGREVSSKQWYAPEDIKELAKWSPPPKRPRTPFVNITAPLFA